MSDKEKVKEKVREKCVDGKLPCAAALKLANELGVAPKLVGESANELKVKIVSCQLGCFK